MIRDEGTKDRTCYSKHNHVVQAYATLFESTNCNFFQGPKLIKNVHLSTVTPIKLLLMDTTVQTGAAACSYFNGKEGVSLRLKRWLYEDDAPQHCAKKNTTKRYFCKLFSKLHNVNIFRVSCDRYSLV